MPMHEEDALPADLIFQDKPLVDAQPGHEGKAAALAFAVIIIAAAQELLVFLDIIMIAEEHIQPVFPVKSRQQFKDIRVCLDDFLHAPVFPQFISVPKFDIGVVILIIIAQGGGVDAPVFQEIIAPVPRAPVAVAHDGKPRQTVERNDGRGAE